MSIELKGVTCLACGGALEATATQGKRAAIYVVCVECNAQTFIRARSAIGKFEQRFGTAWRQAPAPKVQPKGGEGDDGKKDETAARRGGDRKRSGLWDDDDG